MEGMHGGIRSADRVWEYGDTWRLQQENHHCVLMTGKRSMQGTNSSKRKKAAKLKRVMQAVKKHERREAGYVSESFAAIQLLHDPQVRSDCPPVSAVPGPGHLIFSYGGLPRSSWNWWQSRPCCQVVVSSIA